ncbi:hypothetical protein ACFWP3_20370 [Streptomyces sp. NPDC058525]|uniref:hypothetical protein n=1 Tax=unclassified Streptomyces TaxID=2593676 RepID=UPI00364CA3AE
MTNRIIHSCARGVRGIDIPDGPWPRPEAVPEPSQDLLDRALVGWERFLHAAHQGAEPWDD